MQQQQPLQSQQSKQTLQNSSSTYPRVEHQFLTRMPDVNSVETDLMKLLNDFSNSRLKKYGNTSIFLFFKINSSLIYFNFYTGNNNIHEKFFKQMDLIRDKQEKIAKIHFEQDSRLNETK